MLKGKTILLGVTGSIAAYKIAYLASALVKAGAKVHVLMTQNATNFINPITFETLTGNKCLIDTFDRNFQFNVEHVALAKRADIFMVAPASANVIGKMANGIADDMLTTTILFLQTSLSRISALRGMGKSLEPSIITILGTVVFRMIWLVTVFKLVPTYDMLMNVYVASWIFTGVAIFIVYVHHMKREEGRMGQQTL